MPHAKVLLGCLAIAINLVAPAVGAGGGGAAVLFPPAPTDINSVKSIAAILGLHVYRGASQDQDAHDTHASKAVRAWFQTVYSSTWWLNRAGTPAGGEGAVPNGELECLTTEHTHVRSGGTLQLPASDSLTTTGILNASNVQLANVIDLFRSRKLPDSAVGMMDSTGAKAPFKSGRFVRGGENQVKEKLEEGYAFIFRTQWLRTVHVGCAMHGYGSAAPVIGCVLVCLRL